jgi:hypothetical protein
MPEVQASPSGWDGKAGNSPRRRQVPLTHLVPLILAEGNGGTNQLPSINISGERADLRLGIWRHSSAKRRRLNDADCSTMIL